jgi:hypothetical protein
VSWNETSARDLNSRIDDATKPAQGRHGTAVEPISRRRRRPAHLVTPGAASRAPPRGNACRVDQRDAARLSHERLAPSTLSAWICALRVGVAMLSLAAAREMQLLGDRDEIAEMAQFHGQDYEVSAYKARHQ